MFEDVDSALFSYHIWFCSGAWLILSPLCLGLEVTSSSWMGRFEVAEGLL